MDFDPPLSPQQIRLRSLIDQHKPVPKKRQEETNLMHRLRELSTSLRTRLFRNNNGVLKDRHGHRVTYGLGLGSSDFVGYRVVLVTPAMVGQRIAQFAAVEVKAPGKSSDPQHLARQQAWIAAVVQDGGIGGIVRSEEELIALLSSV